jgi:copper chaperone CopZ
MKKLFLAFILFGVLHSPGFSQIGKILNKVKDDVKSLTGDDKTGLGLKEALNNGVGSAVGQLSLADGFLNSSYKVLIPEDAQKVINVVKKVPGFQDVEIKLIKQMNQAAEIAVKKATPIFTNAITKMSFADAKKILFGSNDAATRYLESSSRQALYTEFLPIIQSSLDEVKARIYWKTVVDAYNKIPLQKKMNPELDAHVNNKALDGLFSLIQVKEDGIRNDINQRTSPLLKEVFGQVKK